MTDDFPPKNAFADLGGYVSETHGRTSRSLDGGAQWMTHYACDASADACCANGRLQLRPSSADNIERRNRNAATKMTKLGVLYVFHTRNFRHSAGRRLECTAAGSAYVLPATASPRPGLERY